MVMFPKASLDQCDVIRHALDDLCVASGYKVSLSKTSVFFSKNVESGLRQAIVNSFGYVEVTDLGMYLGVPLTHQIVTNATYQYIIQRV
ncbi:hypothetical protein GQ457_02G018060 [Hibiscus cannabinus]